MFSSLQMRKKEIWIFYAAREMEKVGGRLEFFEGLCYTTAKANFRLLKHGTLRPVLR